MIVDDEIRLGELMQLFIVQEGFGEKYGELRGHALELLVY